MRNVHLILSQLFSEIVPEAKVEGRELQESCSLESKGGDEEKEQSKAETKSDYEDDEDEDLILLVGLLNVINNY